MSARLSGLALVAAMVTVAAGPARATGAQLPGPAKGSAASSTATGAGGLLARAKSWGYQLRAIDPAEIARSSYDIVVIDFAQQGRPFTADEVKAMQAKPGGGRRVVLAYLSIGEAERYRFYWQPNWYLQPPSWIGPENAEWKGNYLVRFWEAGWRQVLFGSAGAYLDRIVAAGFDGVYLDRVDAYVEWEKEQPEARDRMVELVGELAGHARKARPGFQIVVQNAEELLEDDDFVALVDGIAKEDLLHGIDHTDAANPADDVKHSGELLQRARKAGKAVLVVEYLCKRDDIARVERRLSKEFGFVPYVAARTLHKLGLTEEDYCLPPGPQGRRIALVVGNGGYDHAPPLTQPASGAKAVAASLRQAGFTQVLARIDLSRDAFNHEVQRFAEAARDADWAVLYFAGLGLHFENANYLLPTNARIERPADIAREALPMEDLVRAVEPARRVRLVLLDACRSTPFIGSMRQRGLTQAAGEGVSARPTPRPVAIGYASRCETPTVVPVGEADPYTAALLRHIPTAGLELPWLMERTRDSVLRATRGLQEPVYVGTFPDAAMVTSPAGDGSPPKTSVPAPARR